MKCEKPYQGMFPCMRCMACRINRRRVWTTRIVLESLMHEPSTCFFLTLTYDEENLPCGGTLVPKDLQDFLKRLRFNSGQSGLRFFAVGEYGEESWRPHYHVVLFGLKLPLHWNPGKSTPVCSCVVCQSWSAGGVHIARLSRSLAQYSAGYVLKKLTVRDSVYSARAVIPEFCRMSLKPGIGAIAAHVIAEAHIDKQTGEFRLDDYGDVRAAIRFDRQLWPLGRYLRRRIREKVLGDPGQSKRMEVLRGLEHLAKDWRDLSKAEGARRHFAAKARREWSKTKQGKGRI